MKRSISKLVHISFVFALATCKQNEMIGNARFDLIMHLFPAYVVVQICLCFSPNNSSVVLHFFLSSASKLRRKCTKGAQVKSRSGILCRSHPHNGPSILPCSGDFQPSTASSGWHPQWWLE